MDKEYFPKAPVLRARIESFLFRLMPLALWGFAAYTFFSRPALAICLLVVSIPLYVLSKRISLFWSLQVYSYHLEGDTLYCRSPDGDTVQLELNRSVTVEYRGPFGETYDKPTGGYGLVVLTDGSSRIRFSPLYVEKLVNDLFGRGVLRESKR